MADTRGTWSLSETWAEKSAAEWVPIPNVWVQDALEDAGYIAGGTDGPGPYNSRYDKIAYSTDTKSTLTAVLSGNIAARGGASSPTAGYTMGGLFPASPDGKSSKIDKLTYATSTNSQLTGTLDDSRTWGSAGGGSSTAGYLCGGYNPDISDIRKVTYATDTIETLPANISNPAGANYNMGSAGNADDFLYLIGGASGSGGEVKKFTYSSESCANVPDMPSPSVHRSQKAGCSSSSLAAYIVGGANPYSSKIAKITFSNDTTSYVTNSTIPTNNGRFQLAGTGSPSAGYFSGGTDLSITEKITMSTENCSRIPALDLTIGGKRQTGISAKQDNRGAPNPLRWFDDAAASPNYGYSVSGRNAPSPSQNSTAHKIDFSTDGNSAAPGVNNYISANMVFGAGSTTNGYIMGGTDFSPSDGESQVTKVTYSTETRSDLGSSHLGAKRYACYAMTHGNTAVYVLGGRGPEKSDCRKMTYSNDTFSGVPSDANLSAAKYAGSSVATSTAGYMIGGSTNGIAVISSVDKITFATETTARIPSADTSTALKGIKGLSESTAGYSVGGSTWPSVFSVIQKLTFASETSENLSPTLPRNTREMQTLGNDTRGYVVGGNPGYYSSVDKFVYATSTLSAVDNLPTGQSVGEGISPGNDNLPFYSPPTATPTSPTTNMGIPENGYIAGGFGNVSSISKLDMSSETYTRLDTALYETNKRLTGFGNLTQGYATGGTQPVRTTCQKFVYSTDTRTTLTSNLTAARGYLKAIGNNTAGYVGGGTPQGSYGTKLDKMPYSNETFSSLPNIPGSRYRYASLGNQTQGYFAGGYPSQQSKVKKITYSSDSYANAPNLTYSATFQTGTGNATKGYFVSGEGGGTKVDRITFSNDTISRVPSADLSATRYALEANNSPSKAYFTGGSPGVKTNTEVITFSNDTTALSTTANADTGDNQAGAFAAFGPNWCGNPGSDIQPNII